MSEFSIAIPTHDRGENGPIWLRELLNSLKVQTFQDFDVVISDQSKNDSILDTCKEYSDHFDFTFVRYQGDVPCENINIALNECTGRIIKIMFSDDLFVTEDALETIHKEYAKIGCSWMFSGFCGTRDGVNLYDKKKPVWTKETLEGRNLLSSPTVVSFLNKCKLKFDTNLKLLLDVDFYHRMRWKHGMPHLISDVLVANRDHDDRISSDSTSQYDMVVQHPTGGWMMNRRELMYIRGKYPNFFDHYNYPDEL